MQTKLHKWGLIKQGGKIPVAIWYGVQVKNGRKWMHAYRGTEPLIFKTKREAEAERKRIEAGE